MTTHRTNASWVAIDGYRLGHWTCVCGANGNARNLADAVGAASDHHERSIHPSHTERLRAICLESEAVYVSVPRMMLLAELETHDRCKTRVALAART